MFQSRPDQGARDRSCRGFASVPGGLVGAWGGARNVAECRPGRGDPVLVREKNKKRHSGRV